MYPQRPDHVKMRFYVCVKASGYYTTSSWHISCCFPPINTHAHPTPVSLPPPYSPLPHQKVSFPPSSASIHVTHLSTAALKHRSCSLHPSPPPNNSLSEFVPFSPSHNLVFLLHKLAFRHPSIHPQHFASLPWTLAASQYSHLPSQTYDIELTAFVE